MKKLAILFAIIVGCTNSVHAQGYGEPDANGERPFVIVTASYNNKDWYQINLNSVFNQQYSNFRVIYIDDCSTDGTADLVQSYITDHGLMQKFTLIRNATRRCAAANQYHAIHSCKNNEIVVLLDGDDWLANPQVLSELNKTYSNKKIWLAYSQFVMYPSNEIGWNRFYDKQFIDNAHDRGWAPSHLRTFYAGLFKKIKIQDLLYQGEFLKMTSDMAIMLPLIEMARDGHMAFLPRIMCVYNGANPLNDHKVDKTLQATLDRHIRSLPRYSALKSLK